jgi:hypothetical protein
MKSGRETLRSLHRGPLRLRVALEMARPAFDAALARICAAFPNSHAVFDATDDTLVLANPAFINEFGTLPLSRSSFERRFEPVGYSNAPGRLPLPEQREEGQLAHEINQPLARIVNCLTAARALLAQLEKTGAPTRSPSRRCGAAP